MSELIVTSYPQSQTELRRRFQRLMSGGEQAVFRSILRFRGNWLDLLGEGEPGFGGQRIDPLEYTEGKTLETAETSAYGVAKNWLQDVLKISSDFGWSQDRIERFSTAIEAEWFRVLKEFLIAVLVTEKVIEKRSPKRVVFLDSALASVVNVDSQIQIRSRGLGAFHRLADGSLECLRVLKETRPWFVPDSAIEKMAGRRLLTFSDMASHARVLAPLIDRIGREQSAALCSDDAGEWQYRNFNLDILKMERERKPFLDKSEFAKLATLFKILGSSEFIEKHEDYRVFRSSWARMQVLLLLVQAMGWERFWTRVLDRIQPESVLVSVAIWPAYRILLDCASQRGMKTAIAMHGNIPEYPPYYSKPEPDIYTVFGETYRRNLTHCGLSENNIVVTGVPLAETGNLLVESRKRSSNSEVPTVVFLQSPPGSELNWLDYRRMVEMFVQVATLQPDWRFVVKLHPHPSNDGHEFSNTAKRLGARNLDIVKHIPISQCLENASAAVAVFSTTIFDSLIQGVPVIVLRPQGRKPLMPFGEMGLAKEVETMEELLNSLTDTVQGSDFTWESENAQAFFACQGEVALRRTVEAIVGKLLP